jgi:hypothetical protein
LFAAAFATGNTLATFKVGLAASVGAGISMGFAEAMSDDGKLSGRGTPWIRGAVCGLMTTLGGLGHTMPYLIRDFHLATTIALAVVAWNWRLLRGFANATWTRHCLRRCSKSSWVVCLSFSPAG